MTKSEWETYRLRFKEGQEVVVYWRWNWGTTEAKRQREWRGEINFINERGVEQFRGPKFSYKRIESIVDLYEADEPDAVLTPEGWEKA